MSRKVTRRFDDKGRHIANMVSTTNDRERPLVSWNMLPETEQADFDYLQPSERDDLRFVKAYGSWHDVDDTEGLAPADLAAQGWSVYYSDSVWTGVVFRHFDAEGVYLDETVVVGRYGSEDVR